MILIDTCFSLKLSLKYCFHRIVHGWKQNTETSAANLVTKTAVDQPLDVIKEESEPSIEDQLQEQEQEQK